MITTTMKGMTTATITNIISAEMITEEMMTVTITTAKTIATNVGTMMITKIKSVEEDINL
ncbi:MAG: hypothetical protein ABJB11_22140 [Ferruginibacter sp.]